MQSKIRASLTFSNVTALLALFVALGGTGYAALRVPKNSVGSRQIKNGAVTHRKLATNAIGTNNIADGAVTTPKLANGAVNTAKLGAGAVTSPNIAAGQVGTTNLADGGVTGPKLATGAVGTANLADGAVTNGKLASNAVTTANVLDGTLLKADVAAGQFLGGTVVVRRTDVTVPAASTGVDGFAGCQAGETLIGGSANVSDFANATVVISRPATTNVGAGGIPNDGDTPLFWKGTAIGYGAYENPGGGTVPAAGGTLRVFAVCAK
jgi:hypothetical protein